ncbi:MAG TPA: type VI secretion system contractile sheath large subunit [Polyangiaceae bacterium]|nr:type VI secretion system contractile sheath large subunit [Polyangiaceae bacterium]
MAESIQQKLLRVRPPRVRITYDVETGGAIEKRELPFIVGILADLSGTHPAVEKPPLKERKFVEIDHATFDSVMKTISPGVQITYEEPPAQGSGAQGGGAQGGGAQGGGAQPAKPRKQTATLVFNKLDDFMPTEIVRRFSPLGSIFEVRVALRDIQSQLESNEEVEALMEALVKNDAQGKKLRDALKAAYSTPAPADPAQEPRLEDVLKPDFASLIPEHVPEMTTQRLVAFNRTLRLLVTQLDRLLEQGQVTPAVVSKLLDLLVAEHDERLGGILNQILHAPELQSLEASWRGLHYLVSKTETGSLLKLRLLNVSRDELAENLAKAVEFDQSHVFKLIYEAEYGTLGGHPFSMLMGDYTFGRDSASVALLSDIAKVAAAAHAPFVSAVAPDMFGIKTFEALAKPRDLAQIFESPELNEWHALRSSEDSRYITLVLPRVLLRLPHEGTAQGNQMVTFRERVQIDAAAAAAAGDPSDIIDESLCLWGNPAYVLTERITHAFTLYRWTAAIRGVEGGGLVEDLPNYTYQTPAGEVALLCPTQVTITDRREQELNKLGFVALCHCKGTNTAAFFGGQTTNNPKVYLSDTATANAALSSRLPYILAASRFAHYVKVIMRDKIGSFQTKAQIAGHLNQWITQYVLLDDGAGQQAKASFPLRAARIDVTEVPGRPGSFQATMFLRPHFQLEDIATSIRLVAQLPG